MATVPPFPHEPTRPRLSRPGSGAAAQSGGRGAGQWGAGAGSDPGSGQGGPGGTISRIPPHSFEAEESLLGAMLLSRDAIAVAVEDVSADDFYRPSHGHIFAAITSLYARAEPADAVTVSEEMRRLGTLDPAGGISALVSLQANTPAISSASRYARIVQEHAQLRRLIGTAYEIAEMGYQLPTDVVAALDRAEAMVFDVAQRRSSDSTRALKDLLTESLEHLEYLANRDETITGVPTGYHDLDMELFGLQPSNLVVVGARPSMGKALALDTPIPTPAGWTTMGSVEVGDKVFDDRGEACTVTYVSPVQFRRKCYRVEFDDGSTIVADADHQWSAYDFSALSATRERQRRAFGPAPLSPSLAGDQSGRWKHPRVVTTQQMLDEGVTVQRGSRPNWYVALGGPLDLPEQDLPVDPYVLGCWLGEGGTAKSEMTVGDEDLEHFQAEFALAGHPVVDHAKLPYAAVPVSGPGPSPDYSRSDRVLTRELQVDPLLQSNPRHIPARYLRSSFKQRLALLQGILDMEGQATAEGNAELRLADRALCAQVRELVCSLGHKAGQLKRETTVLPDGSLSPAWRLTWAPLDPVFRLERKARALASCCSRRRPGKSTRRAVRNIVPVESVPVRCITVDSPHHLYLAGESMIPTHNTSFVLGMAAHAARSGIPVLLFSLEMSHLELAQRVLCAESRVDAGRLRNGKLVDSDWSKISGAIGRVGTAPLYIDDNPNVTVMDIRAKARRMKSTEGGLGLVIVDYLQLMTGRSSAESRQVEISEISRGLKILARELSIPVVAASQLSRNLEARADKRPMLADLRECLSGSTKVAKAGSNEEVTLAELARSGATDIPVWSLDESCRLVHSSMTGAWSTGIKPVFDVRLASGPNLRLTANHPLLTVSGWVPAGDLAPADRVAVARRIPAGSPSGMSRSLDDQWSTSPATPDVLWDRVVSIDPAGEEEVFDASVPGTHSFLANGVVSHNSGAIEQDADVVMFIYRDEIYNNESSDRGTAEILIAKHRNGPTGVARLSFVSNYARFGDLARM